MKPGVYPDISNDDYHCGPGISKSGLDLIHRSPMHYKAVRDAANDNEPTAAQELGTAFHTLLLEPEKFDDEYVLPFEPPAGALSTIDDLKTALKTAGEKVSGTKPELIQRLLAVQPDAVIADVLKQRYAATNVGRTILSAEQWEQLHRMRDAVMAHPAASALLTGVPGKAEQSVYWIDEETGVLCRCRPDWWREDDLLVDLKTCDDASLDAFARSIANWRYDVQDPFYSDGVKAATGRTPRGFVFIAVEKKPPFAVGVYMLDQESRDLGRLQYRADLRRYAECLATDNWPGYGEKIQSISVPAWHANKNARLIDAV